VRGRGAQRLLGQAAQAGLKLERIAPQADGFTAVVSGQKFQIHAPQKAAQPVQQHKKQADARQNAGAAQQSFC